MGGVSVSLASLKHQGDNQSANYEVVLLLAVEVDFNLDHKVRLSKKQLQKESNIYPDLTVYVTGNNL